MLPFDGLLFFYLLLLFLLPAVLLGMLEKPLKYYGLVVNFVFLIFIFPTLEKLSGLFLFFLFELLLIKLWQKLLKTRKKPVLLWIFVLLSLLPLLITKLSVFFDFSLALLGISYMTFRVVQLILESYDGLVKKTSVLNFYYFVLFFPSVSSGPIDRSRRFEADLNTRLSRDAYYALLKNGVWKLFTGALYNFVFSKLIFVYLLSSMPEGSFLGIAGYAFFYPFFLFFNFAGYSLMAIGTSYLLGIRLPENFNLPFFSRDLKEFWSRWHISLSTWLRDFVYTRFVMASLRGKWFKNKHTGSYLGYVLTMLTTGLWHGLSIRYLIYGLYHGLFMCLNDYLDNNVRQFKKLKSNPRFQPVFMLVTFVVIAFGLLIFSGKIL